VPDVRRILIVKLSAMGDVVHALPAVTYLREAAPKAEIHWAVDTRFAELLEGNPGIAKVVSLPIREWKERPGSRAAWREAIDAAGALRGGKYDLAIDLQGNIKSGVVTYLSGAPLRYGFPREAARERQNLWFTNRHPPAVEADRHVTRKMLRVASAPFGGEFLLDDFKGEVANTPEEIASAERLLFDALPGAAPRLVESAVLLRAESLPRLGKPADPRVPAADLLRPVDAARVDDDHFVGERDRRQAVADIPFLVPRDDDGGDLHGAFPPVDAATDPAMSSAIAAATSAALMAARHSASRGHTLSPLIWHAVHGSGAWRKRWPGPTGAAYRPSLPRKTETVFAPTTAARCSGPVSGPIMWPQAR